jgi:hypothetical protein
MSTSPNGIHNLHFLFGPQATKNLSVATAWVLSNPWRALLDNAAKKSMRIIETTREEHDKKMAIIQWLSHFLLVLLGWPMDQWETSVYHRYWVSLIKQEGNVRVIEWLPFSYHALHALFLWFSYFFWLHYRAGLFMDLRVLMLLRPIGFWWLVDQKGNGGYEFHLVMWT